MKLFGKRKRATDDDREVLIGAESEKPVKKDNKTRTDHQLELLLAKEFESLNAKERRLVRRYQERQGSEPLKQQQTAKEDHDETIRDPAAVVAVAAGTCNGLDEGESVAEKGHDPLQNPDMEPIEKATTVVGKVNAASPGSDGASLDPSNGTTITVKEGEPSEVVSQGEPSLANLLQKLTSKMKRKLTRELEHGGDKDTVRRKAEELLGGNGELAMKTQEDESNQQRTSDEEQVKKRRRKTGATGAALTELSAEERLRRDEQRRLQKEAAERRMSQSEGSGNSGRKHSHPLNSERRRANRRKPRWAPRLKPRSQKS